MNALLKKIASLPGMRSLKDIVLRRTHYLAWWRQRGEILSVRENYARLLLKLEGKVSKGGKLKVLFLFCESAKWKNQSVYDLMAKSDLFDPYICIVKADADHDLSDDDFMAKVEEYKAFCRSRGMRVVEAYGVGGVSADLRHHDPDIVFYPLPWHLQDEHLPQKVSEFALTCYVPYFVPCRVSVAIHSQQDLHKFLFRHFVLNKYWARLYDSSRYFLPIAGGLVGVGHPMLDVFNDPVIGESAQDGCVIYAPHWSIAGCGFLRYSTFLENGKAILEYARNHPEIKWCFKPHPTLRNALAKFAKWTEKEIDDYYNAWAEIGFACYDGSYPELFKRSSCMITDCDSFLVEYSCVNKPLIHLKSSEQYLEDAPPFKKLFDSFYRVEDMSGLYATLDDIVVKGNDPKKAARDKAVKELKLNCSSAAQNIVDYLKELITSN